MWRYRTRRLPPVRYLWSRRQQAVTALPVTVAAPAFAAGAAVSLATSWVLVIRLERIGERLGLSEALLGIVAALAADAPEITSAVSAIAGGQQRLGAGVVIGSNVFNLAALLGLGAVVARLIRLHRKVVLLGGVIAVSVGVVTLAAVVQVIPELVGCVVAVGILLAYAFAIGAGPQTLARLPVPIAWLDWLEVAIAEEEVELEETIHPHRGGRRDAIIGGAALAIVIVASVTMERSASALGTRFAVPEIVVGGLVLAAVTSLPNAVAAVYLARRGRGAAALSTGLNSNTLNASVGLLVPGAIVGLGPPTAETTLVMAWYVGLTVVVLAFAYRDRGITRQVGSLIIAAYAVFIASLIVPPSEVGIQIGLAVATAVAFLIIGAAGMRGARARQAGTVHGNSRASGDDS